MEFELLRVANPYVDELEASRGRSAPFARMDKAVVNSLECALIRHQHRQGRVRQDVARRAAEYHLAQTALGVGALDEEVAVERLRGGQYGLSGRAPFKPDRHRRRPDAVSPQYVPCRRGPAARY